MDNFVSDLGGNKLVNDIIKLEEVEKRLPILLAELKLPNLADTQLPLVNKNPMPKTSYMSYYADASADYVGHLYRTEIREFNYSLH